MVDGLDWPWGCTERHHGQKRGGAGPNLFQDCEKRQVSTKRETHFSDLIYIGQESWEHATLGWLEEHHREVAASHASRLHRTTDDGPCPWGLDCDQETAELEALDTGRLRVSALLRAEVRGDCIPCSDNLWASQGLWIKTHEQTQRSRLGDRVALLLNICRQQCDRLFQEARLQWKLLAARASLQRLHKGLQWKHNDAVYDQSADKAHYPVQWHPAPERCPDGPSAQICPLPKANWSWFHSLAWFSLTSVHIRWRGGSEGGWLGLPDLQAG